MQEKPISPWTNCLHIFRGQRGKRRRKYNANGILRAIRRYNRRKGFPETIDGEAFSARLCCFFRGQQITQRSLGLSELK